MVLNKSIGRNKYGLVVAWLDVRFWGMGECVDRARFLLQESEIVGGCRFALALRQRKKKKM